VPAKRCGREFQYLAFIHAYALLHRRPPAEAEMERYFGVTPPSVRRIVVEPERRGLIRRTPRQAKSIVLCIPAEEIPPLPSQAIKTSASRY
jgi:repressor LexA